MINMAEAVNEESVHLTNINLFLFLIVEWIKNLDIRMAGAKKMVCSTIVAKDKKEIKPSPSVTRRFSITSKMVRMFIYLNLSEKEIIVS